MEGEEARNERHKEHAAADTGHDGDNAEHEAEHEQASGPEPPRMIVHLITRVRIGGSRLGGLSLVRCLYLGSLGGRLLGRGGLLRLHGGR